MKRIKLLPVDVYSKIAAGEVIERPASVIRELIDNSIDANAKEIIIKIEKSGLKKITVIDDGTGIHKDDLALSFSMHATSKIESVDDLLKLDTMGFRGEALYSIQTVSKVSITSSTDSTGKTPGYKISNYGAKPLIPVSVAYNRGTKVEVEDIFYNLPARKKFIKSEISEWNNIKKTVCGKALSFLEISFKLFNNNELVFSTKGDGDFKSAFFSLYKNETQFDIIKYEKKIGNDTSIILYHSASDVFFQNRNYQNIFVNYRPVVINFFYAAIDTGIRSLVSPGRHPLIYVYLNIDSKNIDVNIHPAKKEIKFINQNEIFSAIQTVIIESLSKAINREISGVVQTDFNNYKTNINQSEFDFYSEKNSDNYYSNYYNEVIKKSETNEKIETINSNFDYKILGVVFDTYIVVQKDDKVLLIDQHAAAESILFNHKKGKYKINPESERLLIPIVLELDNYDNMIEKKIDLLNKNKFDIETGEGSSIVIKEIPSVLLNKKNYDFVVEIIKKFLEDVECRENKNIIDSILIEASCKEAVKKGDKLTLIEITEITNEYFKLNISNCPHGRPSHFELTFDGLQKIFQRKK